TCLTEQPSRRATARTSSKEAGAAGSGGEVAVVTGRPSVIAVARCRPPHAAGVRPCHTQTTDRTQPERPAGLGGRCKLLWLRIFGEWGRRPDFRGWSGSLRSVKRGPKAG